MVRIAHISDTHFGRISHPAIVARLIDTVNASGVDVVAISGDLTQRARRSQFRDAARMIDALTAPVLVVPGNHDVYAWWYAPWRVVDPLRRYRRFISSNMYPVFENECVSMLGISSAIGWTIKGGHVGKEDLLSIERHFADTGDAVYKVLVIHHQVTRIGALRKHDVVRSAEPVLAAARRARIDMILCGHLHVSHVEPVEVVGGDRQLIISSAGTATSDRGRSANRRENFFNLISVDRGAITISEHRFDDGFQQFKLDSETRFDRVV